MMAMKVGPWDEPCATRNRRELGLEIRHEAASLAGNTAHLMLAPNSKLSETDMEAVAGGGRTPGKEEWGTGKRPRLNPSVHHFRP